MERAEEADFEKRPFKIPCGDPAFSIQQGGTTSLSKQTERTYDDHDHDDDDEGEILTWTKGIDDQEGERRSFKLVAACRSWCG